MAWAAVLRREGEPVPVVPGRQRCGDGPREKVPRQWRGARCVAGYPLSLPDADRPAPPTHPNRNSPDPTRPCVGQPRLRRSTGGRRQPADRPSWRRAFPPRPPAPRGPWQPRLCRGRSRALPRCRRRQALLQPPPEATSGQSRRPAAVDQAAVDQAAIDSAAAAPPCGVHSGHSIPAPPRRRQGMHWPAHGDSSRRPNAWPDPQARPRSLHPPPGRR